MMNGVAIIPKRTETKKKKSTMENTKGSSTIKQRSPSPSLNRSKLQKSPSVSPSIKSPSGSKASPSRRPEGESIHVCVRIRPPLEREVKDDQIVTVNNQSVEIFDGNKSANFIFDEVWDSNAGQQLLYTKMARQIVSSALDGYNGTILAYGQTGSGKTHTMVGDLQDEDEHGIIPNAVVHMFDAMTEEDSGFSFSASFLEVYNENVRDLFDVNNEKKNLKVRETLDHNFQAYQLVKMKITNPTEAMRVIRKATQRRVTGATAANDRSSRSHIILTIYIEKVIRTTQQQPSITKLNFVDLAGSERYEVANNEKRRGESKKINQSLSCLVSVISALSSARSGHVPYRDSKLTRLLKDSLGGNSKTLMIACIAPSSSSVLESLSTLRFMTRAKKVKNRPRLNEAPVDSIIENMSNELAMYKGSLTRLLQIMHSLSFAADESSFEKSPNPYRRLASMSFDGIGLYSLEPASQEDDDQDMDNLLDEIHCQIDRLQRRLTECKGDGGSHQARSRGDTEPITLGDVLEATLSFEQAHGLKQEIGVLQARQHLINHSSQKDQQQSEHRLERAAEQALVLKTTVSEIKQKMAEREQRRLEKHTSEVEDLHDQLEATARKLEQKTKALSEQQKSMLAYQSDPYSQSQSSMGKLEVVPRSVWISDRDAKTCAKCAKRFSLTVRRHHCRFCGKIFCLTCSKHRLEGVRCCEQCQEQYQAMLKYEEEDSSYRWDPSMYIGELDDEKQKVSKLFTAMQDQLTAVQLTKAHVDSELQEKNDLVQELEAKLRAIKQNQREQKRQSLETVQSEIKLHRVSSDLAAKRSQEEIERLREELEKSQRAITSYRIKADNEKEKACERENQLMAQINEASRPDPVKFERLGKLQAQCEALKQENQALTSRHNELLRSKTKETSAKAKALEHAEKKLSTLEMEQARMQVELGNKTKECSAKIKALGRVEKKLSTLEAEQARVRIEFRAETAEKQMGQMAVIDTLKEQLAGGTDRYRAEHAKVTRLEADVACLNEQKLLLESKLGSAFKDREEIVLKLQHATEQLGSVRDRLSMEHSKALQQEALINQQTHEIERLKCALKAKESKSEELESKATMVPRLRSEIADLRSKNESLNIGTQQLSMTLQSKRMDMRKLAELFHESHDLTLREGPLLKQSSGLRKRWQRRVCTLTHKRLTWRKEGKDAKSKDTKDKDSTIEPTGVLLKDITKTVTLVGLNSGCSSPVNPPSNHEKSVSRSVSYSNWSVSSSAVANAVGGSEPRDKTFITLELPTATRSYFFRCQSKEEAEGWLKDINAARNTAVDINQERKVLTMNIFEELKRERLQERDSDAFASDIVTSLRTNPNSPLSTPTSKYSELTAPDSAPTTPDEDDLNFGPLPSRRKLVPRGVAPQQYLPGGYE